MPAPRTSAGRGISSQAVWAIWLLALALPPLGWIAGLIAVTDDHSRVRTAGRMWLVAGLFSSFAYAALLA